MRLNKKLNSMKTFLLLFFFFFSMSKAVNAECIPVSGLEFERISNSELLSKKNGINFAVLTVRHDNFLNIIPTKARSFRFFSEVLCTNGAENRFHIDGELFFLVSFQVFRK